MQIEQIDKESYMLGHTQCNRDTVQSDLTRLDMIDRTMLSEFLRPEDIEYSEYRVNVDFTAHVKSSQIW